jgi:hypothetical protein
MNDHYSIKNLKRSGNSLSSLMVTPVDICFSTQNKSEWIYIIARKSIVLNIPWIFNSIIYAVAIPALVLFLNSFFHDFLISVFSYLNQTQLFALVFAYFLSIFIYVVNNIAVWYFNVYIVTNERILDYDFFSFSGFKISEAGLTNVEDVTQAQKGFLRSLFNFGTISIQTAGDKLQFIFDDVPNPNFVRNIIVDLSDEVKRSGAILNN